MAVPTNFWGSYGVGYPASINSSEANAGNRENLASEIMFLSPTDTPALNLISKEPLGADYTEWLIDEIDATATGASSEGADHSAEALNGRTRLRNVTQIFQRHFAVTRTQREMSKRGFTPGTKDEYGLQEFKKMKAMLRSIDARLWSLTTADGSASGTTATDRTFANLHAFARASGIATNVSGSFATASFLALHEAMDSEGAEPDTLFVSSGVKADISALILAPLASGNNPSISYNKEIGAREVEIVVDVIVDDFDRVMIVRDRWIPQSSATGTASANVAAYYLVDRSKLKWLVFDEPQTFPVPPTGLSDKGIVFAELSFKVAHPSAVGWGYNVTT